MADVGYQSQLDKPEAAATPGGRGVTAVGRSGPYDLSSLSGTDWNQTFGNNNPYSPSGTDWSSTFARTNTGQPASVSRSATQLSPNPSYVGAPSGSDWSRTFGRTSTALAGNTTPPPSPGDIDNTFFGGSTPTPTPTPRPSLAFYRNRLSDADLSSRDREMYGAGSEFGFLT